MSVPYSPPGRIDLLTALEKQGIHNFYMQYFQTDAAVAELERDVEATIRRIHFSGSGDNRGASTFGMLPPDGGFLDTTVEPEPLPAWMNTEDVTFYANEFRSSGFTGPLNWYRSMHRTTELMAPWRGTPIRQPSMFIAGSRDGVMSFPSSKTALERFPATLPGLRGCHLIEGAGHWIQRERADEVNALLMGFLVGL